MLSSSSSPFRVPTTSSSEVPRPKSRRAVFDVLEFQCHGKSLAHRIHFLSLRAPPKLPVNCSACQELKCSNWVGVSFFYHLLSIKHNRSLTVSCIASFNHVHAFEPQPSTAMQRNLRMSGVGLMLGMLKHFRVTQNRSILQGAHKPDTKAGASKS